MVDMIRARLFLFVWLVGLIFPVTWLGRYAPGYQPTFNAIFGPEWVHIFMHATLYAGLGMLLAIAFKFPAGRKSTFRIVAIILTVGVAQESLQWFSQGNFNLGPIVVQNALFDLIIDILGGMLGLLVFHGFLDRQD